MSIGDTIKTLRTRAGLSQKEFAVIAGVTGSSVSAWEMGKKEPRSGNLNRIAQHFGIDVQILLSGSFEPNVKYQILTPSQHRLMEEIPKTAPEIAEQLEDYLRFLQNNLKHKSSTNTK